MYVQPSALYVFSESEKWNFLHLISGTQVPSGYSSILQKHVGNEKLNGLKSHDTMIVANLQLDTC